MTTKADDTKKPATKDGPEPKPDPADEEPVVDQDVIDNPKIQIEPGMGELLGPDLVKINEDGELETVEGVPDPPYDLNDPSTRKPKYEESKDKH